MKCIRAWGNYYDDHVPKDKILFEVGAEWIVLFRTRGDAKDYKILDLFAYEHHLKMFGNEDAQTAFMDSENNYDFLGGRADDRAADA